MLENWAWSNASLRLLSRHYQTGAPLPADLAARLARSRVASGGVTYSRQLAFALFDQAIHAIGKGAPPPDARRAYADTLAAVAGVAPQNGTAPAARFGHLVGYDARYYSYLWSEVFAADMFASRFEKEGLLSPAPGRAYRAAVLERGGGEDADVLLRRFLGREPNQEAFLRSLGLEADRQEGGGSSGGSGGGGGKESPAVSAAQRAAKAAGAVSAWVGSLRHAVASAVKNATAHV